MLCKHVELWMKQNTSKSRLLSHLLSLSVYLADFDRFGRVKSEADVRKRKTLNLVVCWFPEISSAWDQRNNKRTEHEPRQCLYSVDRNLFAICQCV